MNNRKRLFVLFYIFFFPLLSFGKHIVGGDMTYRYLSDVDSTTKLFEITLVIYRDCASGGGNFDNPAVIGLFKGNLTDATLVSTQNVSISDEQPVVPVVPPCADLNSIGNVCVEWARYVFTQEIEFDAIDNYYIAYQRCCRTDQIVNIFAPNTVGATYYVEITPEGFLGNNSSPTFINYPPTFICQNFGLNFDHSAVDMDGDSLVYHFCTPVSGGGNGMGGGGGGNCNSPVPNPPCSPAWEMVSFLGNFSEQEPILGTPSVSVDSQSGLLNGVPVGLGQYVVGICVDEYRNGIKIGSMARDFQFNIVDCTPTIIADIKETEIVGQQEFLVKNCGELDLTLINESPQVIGLQTVEWEFEIDGNITSTNTYDAMLTLPRFGEYKGTLFLNRGLECADTAYITLIAQPGIYADFGYAYDICTEDPILFSDSTLAQATGGVKTWSWTTPFGTSALQNPAIQFDEYGVFPVTLMVSDTNNCRDTLTQNIIWQPKLLPEVQQFAPVRLCVPDVVVFDLIDSLAAAGVEVYWDFGDGFFQDEYINPTHVYNSVGLFSPIVRMKNAFDCTSVDTLLEAVTVNPTPMADFDFSPKRLSNLINTITFSDKSDSTIVAWEWIFGQQGNSREQNPVFAARDTGLMPVKLTAMNEFGCIDTLVKVLDIVPKIKLYIPNAFSPDKSNGNDRFGVLGIIPGYSFYDLKIWDRWGGLVFETNDPQEGWDGRMAGSKKLVQTGVYVYTVKITSTRGEVSDFEGTVTVVR